MSKIQLAEKWIISLSSSQDQRQENSAKLDIRNTLLAKQDFNMVLFAV